MRLADFRDPNLARRLAGRIAETAAILGRPVRLMEVCGTHTVAVARHGLRALLPPAVELLSGPGCPVCVTAAREIDGALALAREHPVTVATFGDLLRVPGSRGSLEAARAGGADVRVVYSPAEALELAAAAPGRPVVLLGLGFETTAPAFAAVLREARARRLGNLSLLALFKLLPPALRALLIADTTDAERPGAPGRIDGFLLPGHVSAILGLAPYEFLAREFGRPGVITGFEPVEILQGILGLLEQLARDKPAVTNAYRRVVAPDGNPRARALMLEVFRPVAAEWRALGVIPASGLAPRDEYAEFDARRRFPVEPEAVPVEPPGCRCAEVLLGRARPRDCALFGAACTPSRPVGACMVSAEGACAAHYHYGDGG